MKHFAFLFILFSLPVSLFGQQHAPSFFHCGTDELHTALQNSDPAYAAQEQAQEAAYRETVSAQKRGAGSGVLTLPVVVHIVHDNGPENISDAQVLKGIAWLNDAFRNRNYFNPATGVDTEIEFCLAQRDLAGKAFNGIARYASPLTDMSLNLGRPNALTNWDTKNYINIILVREACLFGNCSGVAGFATFPGTHGEPNEGIVMEAKYFGTSAAEATVTAHEMGHYLGLFHTFQSGCKNDNCLTDGDRVCDTPPDNSSGFFPCDAQINSCTTDADDASPQNPFRSPALGGLGDQPDHYRNYMDYALYACRDRFTEGQKQRMRFFVEGIRAALLSSKACLPPCPLPVVAQFAIDPSAVEAGGTVTVSNQSLHAAAYRWYLDGQLVSTDPAPVLTLLSAGSHVLRLEAESALAACEVGSAEKTMEVSCPVVPAFDYVVQGTRLIFSDQSTAADSLLWTLKNGAGKVLAQSKAPADTFDLSGLQYVQLCLLAKNAYCSQSSCVDIPLVGSGIEICDNGLDDDKDGLADRFDPDCPCDTAYFQAYCPVDCEYVPNPDRKFVLKLKWTSEILSNYSAYTANIIVGDIDSDGDIRLVAVKIKQTSNFRAKSENGGFFISQE